MKKVLLLMLAAGTLVFTGCTKTGPVGPQGPQGPQGPTGNANVRAQDAFTVSSWSFSSGDNAYYAQFNLSDITADIYNYGSVQVFIKYDDGSWRPLPDVLNGTMFNYAIFTGGFDILYTNVNGTTPSFPGTQTFRSVVISSALKQAHPNTDWKNYKEVMSVLAQEQTASTAVSQ